MPFKAARHVAIANLKSFGASGHQRLNFDGFIYIGYVAPGTVLIASVYRRWVKTSVLFWGIWHSFVRTHSTLVRWPGALTLRRCTIFSRSHCAFYNGSLYAALGHGLLYRIRAVLLFSIQGYCVKLL